MNAGTRLRKGEIIMQIALRPYVSAGVAVLGAGLIAVTPVLAPDTAQRTVPCT